MLAGAIVGALSSLALSAGAVWPAPRLRAHAACPLRRFASPLVLLADEDGPNPVDVTLELLEWQRLSSMVASMAGTRVGREAMEGGLPVHHDREESELLHRETEEAWTLEQVRNTPIELRGFVNIDPLVTHASKGGVLDGEDLVAIAESLEAAASLVRVLRDSATLDGSGGGDRGISVLPSYFEGVPVQAEIRREIVGAVDESGKVRDSADPSLSELRFARRELASATRRELGKLIQAKSDALAASSASMREDRFVLQVLAKQKHRVPGTVRDVSASGLTLFIEPKAIEPANTKLRQLAKKEA
jgi:DNA mismatch repair protein MutS2